MTEKLKPYLRKSLLVGSIVLLLILLFVLKAKHQRQICEVLTITINAPLERQLISETIIKRNLNKWYSNGLLGDEYGDINLADLEEKLESLPSVKNAEVSFDLKGELLLNIDSRIPVVRIMKVGEASYYLDDEFEKIPAKGSEAARVPIANGNFNAAMIKKVYTLSTHVQESPFMNALTEQIFVTNNGDLAIIPKIRNQRIIIGDTTDLEEKFIKLVDFYNNGLTNIGWDKYRNINIKYKNQVVCN
jgi:cell division protein FtsQ